MPLRRALSVLGEVLITTGVLLALFVAYSVWWTDVVADRQAGDAIDRARGEWVRHSRALPGGVEAVLHIPALGKDYQVGVAEGTTPDVLERGLAGYYTEPHRAVLPGAGPGNFALAAHRDGHGAAFRDIDRLRPGDHITVETSDAFHTYTVRRTLPSTPPTDTGVIAPVPEGSGFTGPGRYLTLTTCTPRFTSLNRLVVWAEQTGSRPRLAYRKAPA